MTDTTKTRITVLMAIYNCADTLREALDSLLAQTYKQFKVILCDDCSTDNTAQVAEEYVEQYSDIFTLIHNSENLKLAASLNHCLEYADTEYVARMDGDDISKPERFQKEIEFLDAHPEYALVSCAMECFDESGTWGIQRKPREPMKTDFATDSPFCHAPSMMRRLALIDVGKYTVRDDLKRGQDYYLWHKFYCKGYKGYNLQEPYYRMRDDKKATFRRGYNLNYFNRIKKSFVYYRVKKEILKNLRLPLRYRIYMFRPILVALLPYMAYTFLHKFNVRKQ